MVRQGRTPGGVDTRGRGALSRRFGHRGRPALATIVVVLLLSSSFGAVPIAASQSYVASDPVTETLAAGADPSPTPEPTPEPTPTPSPTPKPTPWPTPPGTKGLDVSHWNGLPDFGALRDQGMRFVFSKASQGTWFVDDTYQRHTRAARQAGLLVGAYHFFDYNKAGARQAQHFVATLRATSGLGSLLPLVVDVETLGSLGTPNKANAKSRLHGLLDELYRKTGRYPMIYTSRYMWDKVVGSPTSFRKYPLWVACWTCDNMYLPKGWSSWAFWQVGQFKFNGGTKLDGNVYAANMDKLRLERQRNMRLDGGAAWTATKAVKADLRGYDGKEVRVAIGDGPFGSWQPYQRWFDLKLRGKQGKQDVRVQLRSFRNIRSLVLRENIRLDSVAPVVDGPVLRMRAGARIQQSADRVPTAVTMSASDATSGLKASSLNASCGGVERASRTSQSSTLGIKVQLDRSGCTLRGFADDAVGHRTTKRLEPRINYHDIRTGSAKFTFGGAWKTLRNGDALGKTLARAAAGDAQVRFEFDGAQFAIVARRGPAGGRFKVLLDGKHIDTVDLYARDGDGRRIVYVRAVSKGPHVVKLRVTGTAAPKSSGTTVWLDAVLVLDRRK